MKAANKVRCPPVRLAADYVLEGLWCARCRRSMHPAPSADGGRFYSCGPGCGQPPVPALPVEQQARLAALVRCYAALRGVGRSATPRQVYGVDGVDGVDGHGLPISAAEVRRWQQVDPRDARSVLSVAYRRVEIDRHGQVRLVWGHCTGDRHLQLPPEG